MTVEVDDIMALHDMPWTPSRAVHWDHFNWLLDLGLRETLGIRYHGLTPNWRYNDGR